MKNNIIWIFLSLIFGAACSEDKKPEVISLEELIGDVGEMNTDSSGIGANSLNQTASIFTGFVNSQLQSYDTVTLKDFHLLDRFSFSNQKKIRFIGKEDVPYGKTGKATPRADFYYYTFPDSVRTNNALYNYLDEMAAEGEGGPVKLMVDVNAIKMPPMQMFVYDTTIIALHYTCEAVKNNWRPFQDSLFTKYGKKYRYRFDVACGGPLTWER